MTGINNLRNKLTEHIDHPFDNELHAQRNFKVQYPGSNVASLHLAHTNLFKDLRELLFSLPNRVLNSTECKYGS